MGRGKDRVISEGKRTHQVMQSRSLTTSHRQTDAWPVSEQCLLLKKPTPFTPVLLLSVMLRGVEDLFGQLGSAVPAVSPPGLSPSPRLLAGGVRSEEP